MQKHCRHSRVYVRGRLCFDFQSQRGVFLWACISLVCLHELKDSNGYYKGALLSVKCVRNYILGDLKFVYCFFFIASSLWPQNKGISDSF